MRKQSQTLQEFNAELMALRGPARAAKVAAIEDFVRERTDQHRASLPSLHLLSERDLDWLKAAIDNC